METTALNETPRQSRNRRAARRAFDPTQLFAQRDRLPWFWFFVAVAVTVLAALDRYHLIGQFKQRERVVIIDPAQTYYISPLLQFQEAKDLHVQQAELATTHVSRTRPEGFRPRRFVAADVSEVGAAKSPGPAHPRGGRVPRQATAPETGDCPKIDILATRENEVLATVTGQVIRTGIFQEKAFNEAFNFKLSLRLIRNPNMAANGRFPTAVGDFKYEITN